MRNCLRVLLSLVTAVCLFISVLFTFAELITYDDAFFKKQYEENNVTEATKINEKSLMEITDAMQDFLGGKISDLVVYAEVDGQMREVFTPDEKSHMDDVAKVFFLFTVLRSVSIFLIAFILLFDLKLRFSICRMFAAASGFLIVVMGLIGAMVVFWFDQMFTVFHLILFSGGNWMFDPAKSILINLVPEPFFISCGIKLVVGTLVSLAVLFIFNISLVLTKRKKEAVS